jgi:hypothetical protein
MEIRISIVPNKFNNEISDSRLGSEIASSLHNSTRSIQVRHLDLSQYACEICEGDDTENVGRWDKESDLHFGLQGSNLGLELHISSSTYCFNVIAPPTRRAD